jgi:hypothetical protein
MKCHPINGAARTILMTATAIAACLIIPGAAMGIGVGEFSMEILVDGKPLREYPARGTIYIEASRGAEYAVRLHNRSNRRVAVALAVDGLNSIDAKTTSAWAATKWVVDAHESITVDGWQVSQRSARRFYFTTEDDSYGAWLGTIDNLGVIEAVVFRQRVPLRVFSDRDSKRQRESGSSGKAPAAPQNRAAPEASSVLSDELAATGIGREIRNPVRRVRFVADRHSATRLRVRYEYRPQLVQLGVLPPPCDPDPLDRREQARGFDDFEFAPDPFARRPGR